MDNIVGLLGREEVVDNLVAEIKKGKHVILTGPVGIGKSAVLWAALERVGKQVDWLIMLRDHQAKGQFVDMARQMLALGLISAEELDLPVKFHGVPSSKMDWREVKSQINRASMRDLTQAIIPALARAEHKPIIAVDDLTTLTPTQMAFWLAIFDHAQIIVCASEKKARIRKLWWEMKKIEVKPLPRHPHCPLCLSNKVVPIRYGMPPVEMWEESKKGKFVLGGCVISNESAKWHCQACSHEFGKEIPSIEDLENPEPDGIKPLKLEFYIGGFDMSGQYCVKLEGDTVRYGLAFCGEWLEIKAEDTPSLRKWLNFRKKLDSIDIWKWNRKYHNPNVRDGTQWELVIDYGIREKKTYGSNWYPGSINESDIDETPEFKAFLHALSLLLGGVKIG